MHRHQWVASQPTALRLVVKQAHGVAASAASEKPLHNVIEGIMTPNGATWRGAPARASGARPL